MASGERRVEKHRGLKKALQRSQGEAELRVKTKPSIETVVSQLWLLLAAFGAALLAS